MPHTPLISERAVNLKPSLTLAINAKANALRLQGKDICSLSAGEPDFNTPTFIIEAAVEALRKGITRYGPSAGDPELREAVANKLKEVNKIPTSMENVLITNGGKQAIYNLFQIILNPGDEVLIPSPYWLSYPEMAYLAGAKPVILKSLPEEGFSIDIERLEGAINKKSRLLIINSPNNPTGRVLTRKDMESIAEVVRRHEHLMVMSDEIYEFLLAEDQSHESFAAVAPDLKNRIFTVNGFAKGWAMTGWRIGYLSGNKEIIKAANALQSQSTSNVCSFAQRGALAAIQGSKSCIKEMANSYNVRRELLTKGLKEIPGIILTPPKGAFYAFPQLPEGSKDSMSFCEMALEETGLALVPGLAFGNDQCIRLSCAVSKETIQDGLTRLKKII